MHHWIINMKNSFGVTAVMEAVTRRNTDCVKEIGKLDGTNFRTSNSSGESLIDVARRYEWSEIIKYLLNRKRKVDKLKDISTYNVAKHIIS